MTEKRPAYEADRQDRFEVGMADVVGMTQQQAHMMYEIGEDLNRELYEGTMNRDSAIAVLERLIALLENGRRRALP